MDEWREQFKNKFAKFAFRLLVKMMLNTYLISHSGATSSKSLLKKYHLRLGVFA